MTKADESDTLEGFINGLKRRLEKEGDPVSARIFDALIDAARETGSIKRLSFYDLKVMTDRIRDYHFGLATGDLRELVAAAQEVVGSLRLASGFDRIEPYIAPEGFDAIARLRAALPPKPEAQHNEGADS